MKKALLVAVIVSLVAVLLVLGAGMYKFNYLASLPGYDVDGTKIVVDPTVEEAMSRAVLESESDSVSTQLVSDVYPLYAGVTWGSAQVANYAGLSGYLITSLPLTNITDINAISEPFITYYSNQLVGQGWVEDNSMAAGGPGAAVIAYQQGDTHIVLQFSSEFGVNPTDAPAQCPCAVTFSIFSGNK